LFYSGDKPNPSLREFAESHVHDKPLDPNTSDYNVPEFLKPIETNRNSALYGMHPYHLGKKPADAIQEYVRHYTDPSDLVLDPFCGSGSTVLAASTLGRKAIGIDASPAATFIARFVVNPCDPDDLKQRFDSLCARLKPFMDDLYSTTCHLCGSPGTIHHVVYSNVYQCPGCGKQVTLFEAVSGNPPGCPSCFLKSGTIQRITPYLAKYGNRPVAVNFSCHDACTSGRITRSICGTTEEQAAFRRIDLPRIDLIENTPVQHPFPERFMMDVQDSRVPWGDEWRPSRNFRKVRDLFTTRNLKAIAACMHAAGTDDDLRAVITAGMFALSLKAQHLKGGGGYIPGNWSLPPMSKQRNAMETLSKIFSRVLKSKRMIGNGISLNELRLSTQSATDLSALPDSSVDYIFTDPPYGGAVQYAELNFIWEAWLGMDTSWHEHEIVVNSTRGKGLNEWTETMIAAMSECCRVLKPGRWLSLCYHDSSLAMWGIIQDIMIKAGFEIGESTSPLSIDTGSSTYNQRVTRKSVKRDLVINYRKPYSRSQVKKPVLAYSNYGNIVRRIITEFLQSFPGASKDRIFDHLTHVLLRQTRIQDLDFEKVLRDLACQSSDGENAWFLKDSAAKN
jgi:DNA modification methylase